MCRFISRFANDQSGATALEYGLIAGLISLAVVTGATAAGTAVNTIFTAIGTNDAHRQWGRDLEPYVVSGSAVWNIYRAL